MKKKPNRNSPAHHLSREEYGEHCKIETVEPPPGYQQSLIDAGAVPASMAVLYRVHARCPRDSDVMQMIGGGQAFHEVSEPLTMDEAIALQNRWVKKLVSRAWEITVEPDE